MLNDLKFHDIEYKGRVEIKIFGKIRDIRMTNIRIKKNSKQIKFDSNLKKKNTKASGLINKSQIKQIYARAIFEQIH